MLLGVSDGYSVSEEISASDLSTEECLEFLIRQEREHPNHIKVAFAFNYDVNMIVKDVDDESLQRLLDGEWVEHGRYRIKWLTSKWFEIRYRGTYTIIYDMFSFFGCSFLTACKQYLGDDTDLAQVTDGKGKRAVFEWEELDSLILPYMRIELVLMAKLANRLRELLSGIGLDLKSWHGPGAIASELLKVNKVKAHRPDVEPAEIRLAAQYAYAGGRFESYKTGLYEGNVYQYDIRSAYPYALTQCPALTDEYRIDDNPAQGTPVPVFSLNKVRYYDTDMVRTGLNPFALRTDSGAIFFPNFVETWVWGVEYNAALKWRSQYIELVSTMHFHDDGTRPFEFIGDLYSQRAQWKREKNPAQLAAKLGMNSVYGKLAQRVNWDEDTNSAPNWHQLRWAGYLTATCRAMVFDAMAQAPGRIISVETDGIFSEVPLDLDVGPNLGQWDDRTESGNDHYDAIMYVQSGVYFTLEGDNWSTGKTRGFSSNKTHARLALSAVPTLESLVTEQNRFHGLRGNIGTENWRTWQKHPHIVSWGGNGKRFHPKACQVCKDGGTWHCTHFSLPNQVVSAPHPLPWLGEDWTPEKDIAL